MEDWILSETEKYAAAALFALALQQSQIHQYRPSDALASLDEEPVGEGASIGSKSSVSDVPELWIHEKSGLLWPVLRYLKVDEHTWQGLKETAGSSTQVRHHVGSFLKLLLEDKGGTSGERTNKELGLAKTVDAMVLNIESSAISPEVARSHQYEKECREKYGSGTTDIGSDEVAKHNYNAQVRSAGTKNSGISMVNETLEEGAALSRHRKLTICYELISACIANRSAKGYEMSPSRKGYDARHRVSLRLLATWLGLKWIEMEALEIMVACSVMASTKSENAKEEEIKASEGISDDWKRGAIIGAAALTGGTMMAITGGRQLFNFRWTGCLAAPAFGHGIGALASTLGGLIPAVGAGGVAAAGTATGSAAGSVAVAATFGAAGAGISGSKMARRIGDLEEFEFREIGKNRSQGSLVVEILVSGLAFEVEDFVRPWEGHARNSKSSALQWESENLIKLSTAVHDWLTSRITIELMKGGGMMTVLSTLMVALSVPAALVTASDLIDTQWAIGIDRSEKAGALLAEVLLRGLQGNRPVMLVGFSLGARVVFKCLSHLAEAGEDNARLVERVVLLGAPVSIKDESWEITRKVGFNSIYCILLLHVDGFVNAYSTNDWTLGAVYRASMLSEGLAGTQEVDIPGVENVDVTAYIEGHSSYLWMTRQILHWLELDNPHPVFRTSNTNYTKKRALLHDNYIGGVENDLAFDLLMFALGVANLFR